MLIEKALDVYGTQIYRIHYNNVSTWFSDMSKFADMFYYSLYGDEA